VILSLILSINSIARVLVLVRLILLATKLTVDIIDAALDLNIPLFI
jgi:hypothetical protein